MRRALVAVALAITAAAVIAACGSEGHLFIGGANPNGDGGNGDGGSVGDGGMGDGMMSGDLGPDMSKTGPTCGEIVQCAFMCGLTDLSCSQKCFTGAQQEELQAAGALLLCAATKCILGGGGDGGIGFPGGGGGGGGQFEILLCVGTECSNEFGACDGLLGGFGP